VPEVKVIITNKAKNFDNDDDNYDKYYYYEVYPAYVTWFHSYLTNRFSRVVYRDALSTPFEVLSGVPQGNFLGPLFVIVFINDLCSAVKYSNFFLFADDVKIY